MKRNNAISKGKFCVPAGNVIKLRIFTLDINISPLRGLM